LKGKRPFGDAFTDRLDSAISLDHISTAERMPLRPKKHLSDRWPMTSKLGERKRASALPRTANRETPPANRPTLVDVARLAGVSRSTASYALRSDPKIPVHTRKRVQLAAKQLAYTPDPEIARLMHHLRKGRTMSQRSSIALLSFEDEKAPVRNRYYHVLASSAETRCRDTGYSIEAITISPNQMPARRLTTVLRSRGIQGIMILPMISSRDCSTLLDWDQFSVVAATYTAQKLNVNRVVPHHLHNVYLALNELNRRGFKRIGLITEAGDHERVSYAYWAALALHQQEGRSAPIPTIQFERPEALLSWCRSHEPDAILTTEERLGACIELLMKQERLPSTPIVVLNHVNVVLNHVNGNRFEGIYPYPEIIGRIAADLLAAQIQRGERSFAAHPNVTMVEGSWIGSKARR
jgi:DNA-binding LacI/PurR family transcriptional regulator